MRCPTAASKARFRRTAPKAAIASLGSLKEPQEVPKVLLGIDGKDFVWKIQVKRLKAQRGTPASGVKSSMAFQSLTLASWNAWTNASRTLSHASCSSLYSGRSTSRVCPCVCR